ncbi:MAG: hypothetical protein IKI27_04155 [Methanobrevibacter sp.]|uniref:DUF5750 family protein n=1 Tax=Methanobrevibacter TaxID=2172 RepID=UPI00257B2C11|nr:DUF5750 family protein [Methanobrevibacter sp.]MBR2665650.1 hypothetical protein [Methanobrevibacter sp.]MBR3197288.1 hypothetical protein [Methanobrevibacter sp.]MBR7050626.1 hypothetical protein [Methanobrevibacter sp.]
MIVKITDFASGDVNFVEYSVFGLSSEQLNFLNDNLDEKTCIADDALIIRTYFDDELYPFASDVAQYRRDDFIAREEIEMNVFLSSFLEDM